MQMLCIGAKYWILQSYHPKTRCSNFFQIKRNNNLMEIVKEISDAIYSEDKF